MRPTKLLLILAGALAPAALAMAADEKPQFRRLPLKEYRDKMKAGWLGQMAGVAWGGPTEFQFNGVMIPEDKMPPWKPEMINDSFEQDDLYVEMTFLRTLEVHGLDASSREAGIAFASSGYELWHANKAGRNNLRGGIAPPDSGHPRFNKHPDDIDYQIEADFSGLVAPGMPGVVIELGERFGRLMNYGDGLYGGQFIGGMYAEAFFEGDPVKIVEAGLRCIPAESQYAECIRDVLAWHRESPGDWTAAWRKVDEKYQRNPAYRKTSCDKGDYNIDAKLNGAYVVIGLLYGQRDPDRTIVIACRSGQDSDCNPSSAGGVVFASLGLSRIPSKYREKLDERRLWSHTEYSFPRLLEACEKVAREAVLRSGGKIEKDASGEEVLVLPVRDPRPGPLERSWAAGPIAGSQFTAEEKARIKPPAEKRE